MKNIFVLLVVFMIVGCAANGNSIEGFSDAYYKKLASNSNNVKNTKVFLAENKIKFHTFTIDDNAQSGSFGSILMNGVRQSFVNTGFNEWVKANNIELERNELSSFYFENSALDKVNPLKNGKYFSIVSCADFTHAELGLNNETLVLPFTYMLTVMTKDNFQFVSSTTKFWNCDGYEFGDVIYKKNIKVSTTFNSVKVTYDLKKGSTVISDQDKISTIAKDAIMKASIEKINDTEMLQAWKDYLLTLNSSSIEKIKEESKSVIKQEPVELSGLDEAKNNCKELGFKVGTKDFGNCVLKLAK